MKVGDEVSEGTPILIFAPGDGAVDTPPSLVEQQEPAPGPAAANRWPPRSGRPLAAPPAVSDPDVGWSPGGGARRSERAPDGP